MKIIQQIFFILGFYVLGEFLARGISYVIPSIIVPGTLLGMLLLLIALTTKVLKMEAVEDMGAFLTGNMSFFFIPAAVSILEYTDLLAQTIVQIIIVITVTLLLSFLAVAYSVKWTLRIQQLHKQRKDQTHG
ncbi:MAG: CidA/LrgA family protein [Candidatus Izemoplasmatales bacterium]|jgi:holin-like protein|nr:CidA/LrgA family protein [bacterium]MDZ4196747.1 CidA/LrgA family protein [Candidatus Izemoplasmatales bacterium]